MPAVSELGRIFQVIREQGERGITIIELMSATGLSRSCIKNNLKTLINSGRVSEDWLDGDGRGRKSQRLYRALRT